MGVVYRARDEQLGRTVAVKVLMTDFAEEPDVRARFYREAQSAGRLLHRNIITIFDLGDDHGRAFIVMELLAGATLADYMARPEASDLESKLDLMIQVCDGLSTAHAAGIIHRDIKPGNLFVLNDGGLKILDFGVARLVTSSMTVKGHIIGTPSYMSPEQATGRDIDHRSDIFSAGGVFYWMLTGRKPFAAPDLPSVLRKVQFEDPPALRDQDAPAPLARIVFRALAKDPGLRYQRISDMLGDLQRFRRQFESDALRLGVVAQGHVGVIQALGADIARLAARLGSVVQQGPDPLAAVRQRHPILAERGLASLGTLAFRHAVTTEIVGDLERVRAAMEVEQAALRAASQALDAGEALLSIGDHARACEQFEAALAACPSAATAQDGVARCRRALAERAAAAQPPACAPLVAPAPEAAVSAPRLSHGRPVRRRADAGLRRDAGRFERGRRPAGRSDARGPVPRQPGATAKAIGVVQPRRGAHVDQPRPVPARARCGVRGAGVGAGRRRGRRASRGGRRRAGDRCRGDGGRHAERGGCLRAGRFGVRRRDGGDRNDHFGPRSRVSPLI